jgi:hypothetical protein
LFKNITMLADELEERSRRRRDEAGKRHRAA